MLFALHWPFRASYIHGFMALLGAEFARCRMDGAQDPIPELDYAQCKSPFDVRVLAFNPLR